MKVKKIRKPERKVSAMNISGISPSQPPVNSQKPPEGAGEIESKIKALEQKIHELDAEKQKAAQSGDKERGKKLEQQIQEIRKEIERLRSQEKNRQEESARQPGAVSREKDPEKGKYVDELL